MKDYKYKSYKRIHKYSHASDIEKEKISRETSNYERYQRKASKVGLICMKKYLIFVIMACILIFSACANQEKNLAQGESYNKSVSENNIITYSIRGTTNYDRLQKFINNVDKNKIDKIKLVRYTTEGDPIITQLYFNEKDIEIAIDNSKDKFGGPDKNKILYSSIKGGKQLKDDLIKYLKDNGFFSKD